MKLGPPRPKTSNLKFDTGAVRDRNVAAAKDGEFPARFDLISPVALQRLAKTYGEGAAKYDDHNWRKGFPFSVVINHGLAHIVAYIQGDNSEDHLAHAAWNIFALMHLEATMPHLDDRKTDDYPLSVPSV